MSAAKHADVLFVKMKPDNENDLHAYCKREGIPHVLFASFADALRDVSAIVAGERTKEDILAHGQDILEKPTSDEGASKSAASGSADPSSISSGELPEGKRA